MLADGEEVAIRKEDHRIVMSQLLKDDPMVNLGKRPVECGVSDASEHREAIVERIENCANLGNL